MNNLVMDDARSFLLTSRLAKSTKELYERYLIEFLEWITVNRIAMRRVRPKDVAEWLDCHPNWSDSTRHSACASVRAFYRASYGDKHPVLSFNVRRGESPPQPTPGLDAVEKLLASFDTTTARGRCFLAMVTLMLDTGLRAAELVSLELERLDLGRGVLWVRVKGDRWQPKSFFEYTCSCLGAWLAIRDQVALPSTKTVFVVCYGHTKGEAIKKNGLRTMFKRFGPLADIGKITPHDLRRAFATMAIENGAPTRLVQEAGGWENLQMVEHYTRSLRLSAMAKYSPVDRLMGIIPPPDKS